jgi:hypothetical protein
VAAAGGGIARHTDRAELAKTLQDRHALELAGFDAAAGCNRLHSEADPAEVLHRREPAERLEAQGTSKRRTRAYRGRARDPEESPRDYRRLQRGALGDALTLYQEKFGPSMHGYEAGHTFTHHHPKGNPPSLLDLDEILRNPRQVLRIVAEQKDGSIDLYEMKVEGDLDAKEKEVLFMLFKSKVDGVPDTPEQRLLAMALTVDASGGKLKFRKRRFER